MKTLNIFTIFLLCSISIYAQESNWEVPHSEKSVVNPVLLSGQVLFEGKQLYIENCSYCHGISGLGDGEIAATLSENPTNFTELDFSKETDGTLFWKITTGKSPMVRWKGALKDEEVWKIIHYLKTLEKPVD